jgi:hypothetical protein
VKSNGSYQVLATLRLCVLFLLLSTEWFRRQVF